MHGGLDAPGARRAFADAIAALKQTLGVVDDEQIEAPFHLGIDDMPVTLDQTGDERSLKISIEVGALASDPVHLNGQLRRILKRNLSLLRDQRFVAVLEEAEEGRLMLQLQFAEPYAELRTAALAGRLGELVSMAEFYAELLTMGRRARPTVAAAIEETLIFRP